MGRLSAQEKKEIGAMIEAFPMSGFTSKLSPSTCNTYGSFVGRDFKLLAQMSLFTLWDYLTTSEKEVWLTLSKVHNNRCYAIKDL